MKRLKFLKITPNTKISEVDGSGFYWGWGVSNFTLIPSFSSHRYVICSNLPLSSHRNTNRRKASFSNVNQAKPGRSRKE